MSSPMYETPAHMLIPVNVDGDGPLDIHDPDIAGYVCWCGDPDCAGPVL
jgi:hypothetical protein